MTSYTDKKHILSLCGGIGGAKLVLGLMHSLEDSELTVVVNTGDDFEHLGLYVCPDLDTVTYTLAGLNDKKKGWGRANESWHFMESMHMLDHDNSWFSLGDRDLATNIYRTHRLNSGTKLARITDEITTKLGVKTKILPMSNDKVSTIVNTTDGSLCFQDYFVKHQCKPRVTGIQYSGSETASPLAEFMDVLNEPDLKAVIICPSNPYLSIDPIMAIPGVVDALINCTAPVIAISPIVAGKAIKGPTAKIMSELGVDSNSLTVARHYEKILDGFILDKNDVAFSEQISEIGLAVFTENIVMNSTEDKCQLAESVLKFSSIISKK